MSDWLEATIERILSSPAFAHSAPRVLEIGCGDGLIVDRIAPHSASYLATDFSQTTLDRLAERLRTSGGRANDRVSLLCARADDFDGIPSGAFDVVILNSVAQYFPGVSYLLKVLENAIRAAATGASIFIGDVRSLPLLEAFCASVELYRASVSLPIQELKRRIRRRRWQEKELAVDPAFFTALARTQPRIREVRIQPKAFRARNELTLFRYDVMLRLDEAPNTETSSDTIRWFDAERRQLGLPLIRQMLEKQEAQAIGLLRVPNRRLSQEARLVELLATSLEFEGDPLETVADLEQELRGAARAGIDPVDILDLARETSYRAELSWLDSSTDGRYHVLLTRDGQEVKGGGSLTGPFPSPRQEPTKPWSTYGNNPLGDRTDRALAEELRQHLKRQLPGYMAPAAFVMLDRLPMTPNGKIDHRALPPPESLRSETRGSFQAPRGPMEEVLTEIWSEVLGIEGLGVRDNYFALGGDSILSIQIVGKAHQQGLQITPRDLFLHQTVADLAMVLQETHAEEADEVRRASTTDEPPQIAPRSPDVPLLPIQRWFLDRNLPEPWHFNWAELVKLRLSLKPTVLAAAVALLSRHHDALRLRFTREDGTWRQTLAEPDNDAPAAWIDLSGLSARDAEIVMARAAADLQRSLDLAFGPLFRTICFDLGSERAQRLLFLIHHLVIDGLSWAILFEDLEYLCRRLADRQSVSLPPKTASFQQWAERLVIDAGSATTRAELDYWAASRPETPLPLDPVQGDGHPRGANTMASARTVTKSLDAESTRQLLRDVPAVYRTRTPEVVLTALMKSFQRWTGQSRLAIELEGHGREPDQIGGAEDLDLSRTVGWFATTFPVTLDLSGVSGDAQALKIVKERLRKPPRQGIGYGLLRYLGGATPDDAFTLQPDPQVAFDYLGQLDSPFSEASLFESCEAPPRDLETREGDRSHVFEIHCGVRDGCLFIEWTYSYELHRRATVEALAEDCLNQLRSLIDHCLSTSAGGVTPSDFPLAGLDQGQLDSIVEALPDPASIQDIYPLSPMQEGMLLHSRLATGSTVYFEQTSWSIGPDLDVDCFRRAWQWLFERHPALRTAFAWQGLPRPVQIVFNDLDLPWRELDWRGYEGDVNRRLDDLLRADRRHGFELSRAPLMRLSLLRLDDGYRLIWSSHHLLLDGWSTPVLFEELTKVYDALRQDMPPRLPAPRPYRRFIAWLETQDRRAAEYFWRRRLAGFTAPTRIANSAASETTPRFDQEPTELSRSLSVDSTARLERFARTHRVTLNTLAQAAWGLLLARHSGMDDVIFGSTFSGRPPGLSGSEAMVGMFINTLPTRLTIADRDSLATWLQQLQEHQLDLLPVQHSPLVDIQKWSEVPPPQPLFDHILVVENYPLRGQRELMEASDRGSFSHTNYPLTVYVLPGEHLSLAMSFDGEQIAPVTAGRLLSRFKHLLESMTRKATVTVAEIPSMDRVERHQALVEWNDTRATPAPSIVDLFEQGAADHPQTIAIASTRAGGLHLSYQQLERRSDRLARHLVAQGVSADRVVALDLAGVPLLVGILAILRAGGACLPLSKQYPEKRRRLMLEDSGAAWLLTEDRSLAVTGVEAIRLTPDGYPRLPSITEAELPVTGGLESLAYLVYTSGSTGRPKGVAMGHRCLNQLVAWHSGHPSLSKPKRTLRFAAVGFDVLFQEIFATLCFGGTLVVISDSEHRDPQALARRIDTHTIERLFLPPIALNQLAGSREHREKQLAGRAVEIIAAGEQLQLTPAILAFLRSRPGSRLHNHYGPSETHVVTAQDVAIDSSAPGDPKKPPIGPPIDGSRIYIANADLSPVPIGATGELFIAGDGLARGYLRRAARTARQFVPDPLGRPGDRLYRTGDLGRHASDGAIEFLGRADHQIKVRGFRVEPGEIEAALAGHPAVRATAVLWVSNRLVAYITLSHAPHSLSAAKLHAFAVARLPNFMVPAAWIFLDTLPLTSSGKIDRLALAQRPILGAESASSARHGAPRNPIETMLVEIWNAVLGVTPGIHDDFFVLGGHSLLLTQVASRIRGSFDVELPLSRLFDRPTVAEIAREIDASLRSSREAGDPAIPPLARQKRPAAIPLSFAQQRLWFLHELNPESDAYHLPEALHLRGELEVGLLHSCLAEIVRRHEILRTVFTRDTSGKARQEIRQSTEVPLRVVDLKRLSSKHRQASIRQLAAIEARRSFDLSRGPLLRTTLFQLRNLEQVLLINQHHIVSDGWSLAIFHRELAALYGATAVGHPSPLPEPEIQYADFALWQRRYLAGDLLQAPLSYWLGQLEGVSPLRLPTDHSLPEEPLAPASPPAASLDFELSSSHSEALRRLSLTSGASLFMTLLAAFTTLLARHGGGWDFAVGTPIANRGHRQLEHLLGFFVNMLALRVPTGPNLGFSRLLEQVRETALEAYAHQDLPFERLVEELGEKPSAGTHPLFQTVLSLQNTPSAPIELPGLTTRPIDLFPPSCRFDLELHLWEDEGRIQGAFEYRSDLFDRSTIIRLTKHFKCLVKSAAAKPRQTLSELPLLSPPERHQLILEWNDSRRSPSPAESQTPDGSLHQIFEARARETPDAVAVVFDAGPSSVRASPLAVTYRQLDRQANELARRLSALRVGPESAVGLCLGRSVELIVGMLAILKVGCAYVPLDPAAPRKRLIRIARTTRLDVTIARREDRARLPTPMAVFVDALTSISPSEPSFDSLASRPDALAYIMFTSGSTGTPKGVGVTHRGIARLVRDTDYVRFTPQDRVAQVSDPSFDAATFEIWGALLAGAQLTVFPRELIMAPNDLVAAVRQQRVSVMLLSTALFHAVASEDPAAFRTVDQMFFGGEAAEPERVREVLDAEPPKRLIHAYGPTEGTVIATWQRVQGLPRAANRVPIGLPIQGATVHVLDLSLRPTLPKSPGELCIGGTGVARGYFGRPRLSAESFVPDPLTFAPGRRLYRTGDRARRRANGELVFLGRFDHQVKIRGFRVEPGEVEAALNRHADVHQALVLLREDADDRRLVAFAVPKHGTEASSLSERLRAHLERQLPDYMTPSQIVAVDALPIGTRGKIDRATLDRLAAESAHHRGHAKLARPQGGSEEVLAEIWRGLLRAEGIGRDDNFFELGGHSLLATRVVSRVRQVFGVELPLATLFEKPTVAQLARVLETAIRGTTARAAASSPVRLRTSPDGEQPLSFAQERLWFLHRLDPESPAYNVPAALLLSPEKHASGLSLSALTTAVSEILRRHSVLRSVFPNTDGTPRQEQLPPTQASNLLPRIDLSTLAPESRQAAARRLIGEAASRPIDLARGPLVRFLILDLGRGQHVLAWVMHHIVTDDWSQGIFARELSALYTAAIRNALSPLPELKVQYSDFAVWQREQAHSSFDADLAYWRRQLEGTSPLELTTDRPRTKAHTYRAASHDFALTPRLTLKLQELAVESGASLYMVMLAAFMTLLHRSTNQRDIVIGTPIAGRRHRELESLIGFFVNMLAMRGEISETRSFRAFLNQIRETALKAYAHQDMPFARLIEALEPDRDLSRNPLFQVTFALQNAPGHELELPGLQVESLDVDAVTTRFELEAHFWEQHGHLAGSLVYDTALFDTTTIVRRVSHLQTLLEHITSDADQHVEDLEQLASSERHQLLVEWNDSAAEETGWLLHQHFEAQVQQSPDATAIVSEHSSGEERLSYSELDRRANAFAVRLASLGVGPETRVSVCLHREPAMIIALLGVLKVGGAYLPLDPTHPAQRLERVLAENDAKVLVATEQLRRKLEGSSGRLVSWLTVEPPGRTDLSTPPKAPDASITTAHAAYFITTSGTSGMPKSVIVSHRAVSNHVLWTLASLPFADTDRVLHKTPIGFDAAASEIWPALASGAQLILARPDGHRDAGYLVEAMRRLRVSKLHVVPHQLGMLLDQPGFDQCQALDRIDCGGEALEARLVERLRQARPDVELVNVYGPTEATIHAAYGACHVSKRNVPQRQVPRRQTAPIGRPIQNARIHLLRKNLMPAPTGTPGRLHISGTGLARGYGERPAMTSEKFVPNRFSNRAGSRLYDSGDIALHLPDGRLLFLGRADRQIKLRGHRIELAEIEAVIERHTSVQRAVAVVAEKSPGDVRLYAFVVASEEPGGPTLGDVLQRELPASMVPSRIIWLRQIPITSSGKVDRALLEDFATTGSRASRFGDLEPLLTDSREESSPRARSRPRTPTEQILAEIWAQVLQNIDRPSLHDNFFELGGHSLLATQVVSRVRRLFGFELPLRGLFENPTLAELATHIEAARPRASATAAPTTIERLTPADRAEAPLSFAQERLWFLHQLEPESSAYNMADAWQLDGDLNVTALETALHRVIHRHETLRTRFPGVSGQARQVVSDDSPKPLTVVDFSQTHDAETSALRLLLQQTHRPFDLERGPLLRYLLMRLGRDRHVLWIGIHHIVSDGWSQGVFRDELTQLYSAETAGQNSPPADPAIQYADFAAWQRNWLSGKTLENQLTYWRRRLEGLPRLRCPTDRPRPAVQTYRAASQPLVLSSHLTSALEKISLDAGASLYMVLLAAFSTLVHRLTGQRDLAVGSPIANRNREEIEGLIGFFVNMLVLRADLSDPAPDRLDFLTLIKRCRDISLEAYAHQDLPFEKLVEELDPERDLSQNPLFQVTLTLQNAPDSAVQLPSLEVSQLELDVSSVRFDLELYAWPGERLELELVYNRDLFDATTAARLSGQLESLLESALAHPRRPISTLALASRAQIHQLKSEWNDAPVSTLPRVELAHQLIERWADRTPDALALASSHLTYRALDQRANQLAQHLRTLGAGPDVTIGVYLERSIEAVIAVFAVLKSGGAYLPIDAAYGRERLSFQLRDSAAPILVTRRDLLEDLIPPDGLKIVCLNEDRSTIRRQPTTRLAPKRQDPRTLAYVTYTSGSTGRPKGVMVSHRSLVNAYLGWEQSYRLPAGGRHLQMASLSFDVFSGDLMRALASGGTLIHCPREQLLAPEELAGLIQQQRISHAEFVPLVANSLARYLNDKAKALVGMQLLAVGSDVWSSEELAALASVTEAGTRIINSYGVTEAAIDSTFFEAATDPAATTSVPIGRPFPGTQLHILDRQAAPTLSGIPGELHIAGVGPARGYFGRPALSAEKLIPNPFTSSDQPGARLYKTGDLARHLQDGNLELIGRVDRQIKIRGFRVEPGEIEATLATHPEVEEAAVVAVQDRDGDDRLVAFAVRTEMALEHKSSWQTERVAQWHSVYEGYYRDEHELQGGTFDIAGWVSSYDDRPIPPEEMREWVDDTVERILPLGSDGEAPRRVLEIGCGTGLLLFRIAPSCEHYLGTDFSGSVLEALGKTLQAHPVPGVELQERPATDFSDIDEGAFDVVILNSVAQYFPGIDYLRQVIAGAVAAADRGGKIFIGDVRGLQQHAAFCASVELHRADDSLSLGELKERAEQRRLREEELLIDSDFFLALEQHPRIHRVQILPKSGRFHNELTRFRYDVVLHRDPPADVTSDVLEPVRVDWPREGLDLAALRSLLSEDPAALLLTRIPNLRLTTETELLERLKRPRAGDTVADLKALLSRRPKQGVEPDDLEALGHEIGYRVELSWASPGTAGEYDALFRRPEIDPKSLDLFGPSPKTIRPWSTYGNDPLRGQAAQQLIPELRGQIQQRLPNYMTPSAFLLIQAMPLLASGKIDRNALARMATQRIAAGQLSNSSRSEPTTRELSATEEALAKIWCDLLAAEHVEPHDPFFELGGHSLMAVRLMARIEKRFGVQLPLAAVFRAPTVEALAAAIDQDLPAESSCLVPIRPAFPERPSHPPLFLVHPIGGHVLCYADLARRLDAGRAVYGLQAQGFDGTRPSHSSIPEMATAYVEAIREVQPQGPYYLGGWSMGGLVAYEMACQLEAAAETVDLLAIIDCGTENPSCLTDEREALRIFARDLGFPSEAVADDEALGLRQLLQRGQQDGILDPALNLDRLRQLYRVFANNDRAMSQYRPSPYAGSLTLIRAASDISPEPSEKDPSLGWTQVVSTVTVRAVPGDHFRLVREPQVQLLANQLERRLLES